MGIGGEEIYRDGPSLSPHLRYFEAVCMAKGAHRGKAEKWARRMVYQNGKRMPQEARHG